MLPYSSNKGIASLSSLIPVFVLIAGLVAGVTLVQRQQEIREKAVVLEPCYVCQGVGVCQKIADPPYCNLGDSECFVNEDCLTTPTPTPGACTVTSENRGCGRNNCSQTSMWQLVTNADCSVTSRCVPNHPECLPTPTPTTPPTCTVKTEDRGCGRSGCSQTSMWQLVTNSDCSTTSRCAPNHPQCLPTPTPSPTPSPYCSTGNLLRCSYGCEPDQYGGKCKPQPTPTPFCSDSAKLACTLIDTPSECEPDINGGTCVRISTTPTDCLVNCLNAGNGAGECNAICQAIINPPSYCSSTAVKVCDLYSIPNKCVPDIYGGHCVIDESKVKQEGEECSQDSDCKSGRCERPYDYGVKICVPAQTCTPGDFIPKDPDKSLSCSWKCSDDGKRWLKQYDDCTEKIEAVKRYCDGNIPVYEETTDTGVKIQYRGKACEAGCKYGFCIADNSKECLSGDISYIQGSCKGISGCPFSFPDRQYDGNCMAECNSQSEWEIAGGCGSINFSGEWTDTERLEVLLTAAEFSNSLLTFSGPLDFKRVDSYNFVISGFAAWLNSLVHNYEGDGKLPFCAVTTYTEGMLGDIIVNLIEVADCGANKDSYAHEMGHHLSDQLENQFMSYKIAVGCELHPFSSELYTFENEQPVSGYGETNCEEAHSEAVAMYLTEPCSMKDQFPIQYEWMKDNYFEGQDSCHLEQGMPLYQRMSNQLANTLNYLDYQFLKAKLKVKKNVLALGDKISAFSQIYAQQKGFTVGLFELGTTKDKVIARLGNSSATNTQGDLTALVYSSLDASNPDVYIFDATNKLIYYRLSPSSIPQEYKTPEVFTKAYGNPEVILESNVALYSSRLFYPRDGFTLVADNYSDTVLGFEQFKPILLEEYLDSWGKDIAKGDTLKPIVSIEGDLDRDKDVDIFDYNGLVEEFGISAPSYADIDTNGKVNIFDYNFLIENFGSKK